MAIFEEVVVGEGEGFEEAVLVLELHKGGGSEVGVGGFADGGGLLLQGEVFVAHSNGNSYQSQIQLFSSLILPHQKYSPDIP